ncbi:MAG: hypothetical protein P1V81_17025 [Planctomycetota bacterium]|nr:hypothetical protein [Planctomycetota bacterium]
MTLKLLLLLPPVLSLGLTLQDPVEGPVEPGVERDPVTELETEYFALADHDANGSLTFREAAASMGLSRDGFAQYDKDRDGLISEAEFRTRMRTLLERTGTFQKPIPKDKQVQPEGAEPAPTGPTPESFVGLYDADVDGRLGPAELAKAAGALGLGKLDPALILGQLDKDKSGFVEPLELAEVLALLEELDAAGLAPSLPTAESIEELFGGAEERPVYLGSTPRPPVIKGPVRPYRRLDLDDDGLIEIEDLNRLVRSSHSRLRPSAVLAGFDLDGDGVVDREEFEASFDG